LLNSVKVAGKLSKKSFLVLETSILVVSISLALFSYSVSGAPEYSWTDTIKLYKDATTVYADIRTFTNNETFPIDVTVEIRRNPSIRILQYYKLSANETDLIIISEGKMTQSKNTYYGLKPGEKLCFTVEAKPKDSAVEGDTATVEVHISYPLVEVPGGTMHVASIEMSTASKTAGPNTFANAIATVTIVDANSVPVKDATVYGHWENVTTDSDSGTTDASGQVSLESESVKNPPSGTTFTFVVDDIVLSGWTYYPSANVETSDSITV